MKVKQLIKALQKMPQDLDVGYSHGDNSEHEVAGWCLRVELLDTADYDRDGMDGEGKSMFDSLPTQCVVIRG